MSDKFYIQYKGDPIEALESALRQYGNGPTFILIPAELWRRLVPNRCRQAEGMATCNG